MYFRDLFNMRVINLPFFIVHYTKHIYVIFQSVLKTILILKEKKIGRGEKLLLKVSQERTAAGGTRTLLQFLPTFLILPTITPMYLVGFTA